MKRFIPVLLGIMLLTILQSVAQTKKPAPFTTELLKVQKRYALNTDRPFISRIGNTPEYVLKMFRDAGMSPTEHQLTREERAMVAKAFTLLPPLHQRVLRQHLKSISFLDNMPNTALTAPVTRDGEVNLYHIAFRAGILRQTISEWVTEKERTSFAGGDSAISVSIKAGLLSAFTYVLLHEGTHVVDGSLQLLAVDTIAGKPQPNAFTKNFSKGAWQNINTHDFSIPDSTVVKSRFRPGGRRFQTNEAEKVYQLLSQTPFVSLYATASWHEDLAEMLTIYHLTQKLRQPFQVVITQNGKELYNYQPMNDQLMIQRTRQLARFYSKS